MGLPAVVQRTVVAVLLLIVASAGCTRRYFVRPSHQARATSTVDAVIPALTNERDPTYLEAAAIRRIEGVDALGLHAVRARDARNFMRTTGWIATGFGVIFASFAVPLLLDRDPSSDGDAMALAFSVDMVVHLAVGIPFLVLGYASDGAEEPGPSPGMPLTLAEP